MTLKIILACIAILLSNCLKAQPELYVPECPTLELRVSYFYPLSSNFRKKFHKDINYQITGTYPTFYEGNNWQKGVNYWYSIEYFSKNSSSKRFNNPKIWMLPVTFGLKYFFPICNCCTPINFYIAAGIKYYFIHYQNKNHCPSFDKYKNGPGGVAEVGFITPIYNNMIFDFFVAYSIKSFDVAPTSNDLSDLLKRDIINLNSLTIGIGVGYKF